MAGHMNILPKMADKYGLAEFAERVQQTGIQVGLFQNARLSSEDSRYCKDEWKVKPSLSEKYATTETWFGKTHYVMCPTTEYFEVLYNRQAEFAWAGINFMQLDQIGAAPSFLCFGKNHGHSSPATAWKEGYLDGYLKNMSGAQRAIRNLVLDGRRMGRSLSVCTGIAQSENVRK